MLRNVWVYIAVVAVVSAGGWFYFVNHAPVTITESDTEPESTQSPAPPAKQADEELARKRREGIGTIKDLKPVPIGQSGQR